MKTKIKILLINAIENTLKVLWIMPVNKKRVVFISFNGKQMSDSPKYLCNYLSKKDLKLDLVWIIDRHEEWADTGFRLIMPNTIKSLIFLLTAKVIVTNNYLPTYLPIRKDTIVINTWHGGGAFKKVGLKAKDVSEYDRWFFCKHERKYTAFISDSEKCEKLFLRESLGYKGTVLRYGLPRNAILQNHDRETMLLKKAIRNRIGVDADILILYAPTFRGNANSGAYIDSSILFDFDKLKEITGQSFHGSCEILYRGHHALKDTVAMNCLDVTDYPDMQELLLACDILLTDYSSCLWDMAIARKPAFVYAPDFNQYNENKGFYVSPSKWPFPVARNEEQLIEAIKSYDEEEYQTKIQRYLNYMGSYEWADSDEIVGDWILSHIYGN